MHESIIGDFNRLDYSDYPDIKFSIGFLQQICRLKCKFCVVPEKEGKPQSVQSVHDLWRGDPYPKKYTSWITIFSAILNGETA